MRPPFDWDQRFGSRGPGDDNNNTGRPNFFGSFGPSMFPRRGQGDNGGLFPSMGPPGGMGPGAGPNAPPGAQPSAGEGADEDQEMAAGGPGSMIGSGAQPPMNAGRSFRGPGQVEPEPAGQTPAMGRGRPPMGQSPEAGMGGPPMSQNPEEMGQDQEMRRRRQQFGGREASRNPQRQNPEEMEPEQDMRRRRQQFDGSEVSRYPQRPSMSQNSEEDSEQGIGRRQQGSRYPQRPQNPEEMEPDQELRRRRQQFDGQESPAARNPQWRSGAQSPSGERDENSLQRPTWSEQETRRRRQQFDGEESRRPRTQLGGSQQPQMSHNPQESGREQDMRRRRENEVSRTQLRGSQHHQTNHNSEESGQDMRRRRAHEASRSAQRPVRQDPELGRQWRSTGDVRSIPSGGGQATRPDSSAQTRGGLYSFNRPTKFQTPQL